MAKGPVMLHVFLLQDLIGQHFKIFLKTIKMSESKNPTFLDTLFSTQRMDNNNKEKITCKFH